MKRFQECNSIIKIWRYRWYLTIPLIYIHIKVFSIDDKECSMNAWKISKGVAQMKMKWYHTTEECNLIIKERIDNKD